MKRNRKPRRSSMTPAPKRLAPSASGSQTNFHPNRYTIMRLICPAHGDMTRLNAVQAATTTEA